MIAAVSVWWRNSWPRVAGIWSFVIGWISNGSEP